MLLYMFKIINLHTSQSETRLREELRSKEAEISRLREELSSSQRQLQEWSKVSMCMDPVRHINTLKACIPFPSYS